MGVDSTDPGRPRVSEWPLAKIAEAVDGDLRPSEAGEIAPDSVSTDTRRLEPGALFVALRGERFDGHDFVDDARERGAVAALVDREEPESDDGEERFASIVVDDTRRAFGVLGREIWDEATDEGLHTVALTGSNGKTTTKELLEILWRASGPTFATPGNYNNEVGVPITLARLPVDAEHLVLEIGANGPSEIADLIRLAPGSERLITSIGHAHTDGFGSIEGVRRAKSEIFEAADGETAAVVPFPEREKLGLEGFPGDIWTFGEKEGADVRVESTEWNGEDGHQIVDLRFRGRRVRLPLGLPGAHNARNLAGAAAAVLAADGPIEPEEVGEALRDVELPGGRWRRTTIGALEVVDDAYNANPTSVRASFRAFLASSPSGGAERPRVAVIGDMLELDDADEWHRRIGRELAESGELAALATVGEFADEMAAAARDADADLTVESFEESEPVGAWLLERRPCFAWLKASRGLKLERAVEAAEETVDE